MFLCFFIMFFFASSFEMLHPIHIEFKKLQTHNNLMNA